jgi:hypothetical protein
MKMRLSRKFPAFSWLFLLVVGPAALAASRHEAPMVAKGRPASTEMRPAGDFCLPGEKLHCTLGPPPVCSCVPAFSPVR